MKKSLIKAAWVALALLSVPHVSWGQSRQSVRKPGR